MEGTMQLEDWLDDLCVRFIINLPEEDLSSVARICFQVEEAQWFYEDFIRTVDPSLPSMSLRTFCLRIFQHCPLLASFSAENHIQAFEEFLQYKTRVPVRGAILLNHEMDSAVLVKGWKKGANWSFPRGKINKDEDDLDCAIREVWEETGLDLRAAGLVPEGKVKYIEINMREQQMRLYVFRDVPMNTHFQPQTRKEISKIEWYRLSELPSFRKKGGQNGNQDGASNANKFYMVAPFLVPLKKWIVAQKKLESKRLPSANTLMPNPHYSLDEVPTEDDTWGHAPPVVQPLPPQIAQPGDISIEGATNELQRLLNLQPAAQGVGSYSTQEDKASALLSMLKSKDLTAQPQMQPNAQLPHTPLGLTTEQPPQPRNPHHHTNQHHPAHLYPNEPPPQFPIHQHQPNMQWHAPQHEAYQLMPQGGHQAPLVHPQPLPPQVQRAMFNQSIFQENVASEVVQRQRLQEHAPPAPSTQTSSIPTAPQSLHLNGKSLALLNAFKKTPSESPAVQPVPPQGYGHQGDAASDYPTYNQHTGVQDNAAVSELAGWMKGQPPVKQNRMQPAPDSHRSSLLDMFRGDQPQAAAPNEAPTPLNQPTILPRPQGGAGAGGSMEKQLLDTLRRAPLASDPQAHFPPKPSYSATDSTAALSDFLALRPRSNQRADQPAVPRSNASSRMHESPQPQPHQQQATQPIRILQRGNPVDSQGYTSPARRSSHSNRPPNSLGYASPANAPLVPSPGVSARKPEASQDQKRQLLSLFGNKKQQQQQQVSLAGQQGGQPSSSIELAAGEVSRSRLASFASGSGDGIQGPPSRGSTQTPISPADQTFLLDYLQSVTNKASR